ncbi:TetR/AcrR family transcriptional regulator [Pseudomonas sp. PDM09]|jgi:TetR/AcrR family transcriptional repressor of nem operon|uniref:acrylate utilization transcriptional regulator AcuR n=1 Tax=Pseudomonas sp. PDM09 TaxID=2769270 RepID=UPI00178364AB|nr:TetR/AcrR family transcriptional regulator [Pseudomonas sp. PDM09]MBD9562162.1 TetR/AcrR family transcriptional regulator [Pseudomonas sp. PDM09]
MIKSSQTPRRGRPPKVSRQNPDTRDALIRCGTEILTEQGFMATGIDGVLKTVGVPKGSFYHYFDSKEDFGRAVMDNYAAYFANKLKRWFLDDSMTPLQRVLAFVEDAKGGMEKYQFRRGCLVGNLSQEVTILPAGFREHLDATLFSWQQQLATCLREAQDAGELARHVDCAELAAYFWIGWEGAVLRARLVKSTAPLNTFINGFMAGLPR